MTSEKPIAIYYDYQEWFRPLFAELDRRSASDISFAGAITRTLEDRSRTHL
ncbi:MAG: hypothetical protein ABJC05_10580 [Pyrinomonadaceae bacterium]